MPNITEHNTLTSKYFIQRLKRFLQLGYPWLILIFVTLTHLDHIISFVEYCRKSPQQLTNILAVFILTIFTSISNIVTRFHLILNREKVYSILPKCHEFHDGNFKCLQKFLIILLTWVFFCLGNMRNVLSAVVIFEGSTLHTYLISRSLSAKIMPPEIPVLFAHITIISSWSFGVGLIVFLGLQLQNAYEKVVEDIKTIARSIIDCIGSDTFLKRPAYFFKKQSAATITTGNGIESLEKTLQDARNKVDMDKEDKDCNNDMQELVRKVKLLKELLNIYNEIIGPLIILYLYGMGSASLFHINEILLAHFGTSHASWPDIFGISEKLFLLFILGKLGQDFKNLIHKSKAELESLRIELKIAGEFKEKWRPINLVIKCMLKWDWKVTANNLIDVDFKLFPVMIATVLTYVMFIFQLKISEQTAAGFAFVNSSNNNNKSNG